MNYLLLCKDDLIRLAKPTTELELALHNKLKECADYEDIVNNTIDDLSANHDATIEAALKPYKTFFDGAVYAFADGAWPGASIEDERLAGLIIDSISRARTTETT